MAVSLKHSKVTTKPDGVDNSLIQPSDWNADHVLTQATNRLLGRTTAGVGATEEISVGSGLGLGSGTLTADVTSVAGRTGAVTLGVTDVSGAAPLASPALTGTPTAPTAAGGTNTTQIATTAFVIGEGYLKSTTAASTYAPLASPALTGSPTAPTATTSDNSTLIATTAFVKNQSYLTTSLAASTYAPLASPTLTGTPVAPTAAADTNTTQIATTAFVIGQASSANPVMDGTAAAGTSLKYARADHVHPTDTSRAPLASPTFTGTPAAPTAAVGTNTTQIATTAYVQAEGFLKATTAATTYAPLASPNLTGTPTAPTAAANTNTTQIATTAFVIGQGYLTTSAAASTYAPLASPTFTGTVTIPAGASISGYLTTSAAAAGYVPQTAATGAATLPSGTSAQRPGSPAAGQVRYNTNTGKFEGYSTTWGNLGGGAAIGDTPPANPGAGDLWWDSDDGNLYVYYTDANSSQWVSVTVGGQGQYLPISGGSMVGDLNFSGTARRITGDTANATISDRLLFQDSTTNSLTAFGVIPNGTSTDAYVQLFNSSTPANSAFLSLFAGATRTAIISSKLGTGTNLPLILNVGGADRMAITTGGDVGIGTNSPASKLSVTGGIITNTVSGNAGINLVSSSGNGRTYGLFSNSFDGSFTIYDNNASSERMRIDSSGNVGIGTAGPGSRLHLYQSGGVRIRMGDSKNVVSVGSIEEANDSAIGFFTQTSTERARIDSSGNLHVGSTGASNWRLSAVASGETSAQFAFVARTSTNIDLFFLRADGAINTGTRPVSPYNNTTGVAANMVVGSDGYLYRSTSSLKYKRDVADATHGLNELLSLRPVTYKGKSESDGETVYGGLIAEEVHDAGLTEFVQYAEDGTPDALAYGNMVSLCIKAIQELKSELDAVKAELATLKGAQ